jgi:hypothetical protein
MAKSNIPPIHALEAARYLNITTTELSMYGFKGLITGKLVTLTERCYTREELNRFKAEVLDKLGE